MSKKLTGHDYAMMRRARRARRQKASAVDPLSITGAPTGYQDDKGKETNNELPTADDRKKTWAMSFPFFKRSRAATRTGVMLGQAWNPEDSRGRLGGEVYFDLSSHINVIAPTRAGKGTNYEIPNLLRGLRNCSVINIDPTGQNYAVTHEARRAMGHKIIVIDPLGITGTPSAGCNPMAECVDLAGKTAIEDCAHISDCLNWGQAAETFFKDGGQDLWTGRIGWLKERDGGRASLGDVMSSIMQATITDKDGKPIQGTSVVAAEMVERSKYRWIRDYGQRFLGGADTSTRTTDSIKQTAQTAGRSLLSESICKDLAKNGVDWKKITQELTTVYIVMPTENLDYHQVWLRLIVSTAINSIYKLAGHKKHDTLLMLSEFYCLGNLPAVRSAMGAAAKFGLRVNPILQNFGQLVDLYERNGAMTFLSNSGCTVFFKPSPADVDTKELISQIAGEQYVLTESISQTQTGELSRSTATTRERVWPAERLDAIPENHALAVFYKHDGIGTRSTVPVCMTPYYEDAECMAVAGEDPYHPWPKGKRPKVANATGGKKRGWAWAIYAYPLRLAVVAVVAISFVKMEGWPPTFAHAQDYLRRSASLEKTPAPVTPALPNVKPLKQAPHSPHRRVVPPALHHSTSPPR